MQHLQRRAPAQGQRVARGAPSAAATTPLLLRPAPQRQQPAAASRCRSSSPARCRCSAEAAAAVTEPEPPAAAPSPDAEQQQQQDQPAAASSSSAASTVPTSDVLELDFCSRPLLDERGKKVWELLLCSPDRSFEYAQYFPNNKINSVELRKALEAVFAQPGAVVPTKIRFFRGAMATIISRALTDLGVKPLPSRRCFTIMNLLEERLEGVYKADARYSAAATSLFNTDLGAPEPLPDALRGEKWAFVQLPLDNLTEMMQPVTQGSMFGATFSLAAAGLGDLPGDTLVPGVAVFSRRSLPLAAWTNGLEIAGVKADVERSCLILETGVSQRWRYGAWRPSADSVAEAQGWEEAKADLGGLHFLAVQPDPDSEELNGLWLLLDKLPPGI